MANADASYGFKPVKMDGSPYSGGTVRCVILSGNGTATFLGDPVQFTAGTSLDGAPEVIQGVADAATMGVVTSFDADPTDLTAIHRKASTQRFCQVVLAENAWFMVQDNGTLGVAAANLRANFILGSGSTTSGQSTAEINAADATADVSGDLLLWAPVNRPDNDATIANADWIVKFQDVQTDGPTTGS